MSFLLVQIRDPSDTIREHEVACFADAAGVSLNALRVHDLLTEEIRPSTLADVECLFVGGSGDYSATANAPWMESAMRSLAVVHDSGIPTFASCWGHQAMARAMGGEVEHRPQTAEVGSIDMTLTPAGRADPVFAELGRTFVAQVGHEDTVTRLPEGATLLASSSRCPVHAYRFDTAPVYCTQFHPELSRADLIRRLDAYPKYVEAISGLPMAEFKRKLRDTPQTGELISRFVSLFVRAGDR